MISDIQAKKKLELEIALWELFKKFTEETGLMVDDVYVSTLDHVEFGGVRQLVYRQPEVKAFKL